MSSLDAPVKVDWYFDFISPFAWLQAEELIGLPAGVEIACKPVLFAGLLQHWGQLGPAEIAPKRTFTYEFMVWKASTLGLALRLPPVHPFNPLPLLRVCALLGSKMPTVLRLFRFVWSEGNASDDAQAWRRVLDELGVRDGGAALQGPVPKQAIRDNGDEAIARGVFGVPTAIVGGRLFWGADATPMLMDYLRGAPCFDSAEMQRARSIGIGKARSLSDTNRSEAHGA